MGQLYRQALSIQNNSPTLIGDQSRWRALRNSNCSGTNLVETKSCVLAMTKARVGGLAAVVAANGGQPNSSEPTAAPVPNPWPAPAALPSTVTTNPPADPDSITVAMSVTATPTNPPVIMGTTNLPDGTILSMVLRGEMPACYPRCGVGMHEATVENGRFTIGSELTGTEKLISDSYIVEVVAGVHVRQPQNVNSVFGKDGEHLRGPYVATLGDDFKYVPVKFPWHPVPSDSEKQGGKSMGLMIHYTKKILVTSDAASDAAARAQAFADQAKRRVENCTYIVNAGREVYGAERQAKIDACIVKSEARTRKPDE